MSAPNDAATAAPQPFPFPVPVTIGRGEGAQTVEALTFRAPKGRELRKVGSLFSVSPSGDVSPNIDACLRLAADLGGVPPAVIDELDARAANRLAWHIAGFFGEQA
jgi:hypothetical protein